MESIKTIAKKILRLKPYQRIIRHRQILSAFRSEPTFIIVGTQKGGTTSLFQYLKQHPDVATSYTKETHFFNRAYHQGISYYKAFFPFKYKTRGKEIGESSPDYIDNPYVPERIAKHYPNIKLIFLFRNPSTRAYSHYKMTCTFPDANENLPFEEAIFKEDERLKDIRSKMQTDNDFYDLKYCYFNYLSKGHYADQLKIWKKHFKDEQMLILRSEDLFENPESVYEVVLDFLKLKQIKLKSPKKYNSREYSEMSPEILSTLNNYYKAYNEEFYQLIRKRYWD